MDSTRSQDQDQNSTQDATALIQQLEQDRAWLLEQIDRGRWQEFRLDLAALERELGQLLQRASEHFSSGSDQL
ncbi:MULTISPECIES: hypothetical protein [unclassified Synechococcus]|uniref:hypothetical protein n=1 Tax=unclassified Synechococcus TaxID=2626047 RepID=UPI000831FD95|nr:MULTISPECIES: hypothetical protein [unclassified Synechococcus]